MGGSYSLVGTIFGQLTQASSYGKEGFLARSKHWKPADLDVDLTGKVFLITGANSGLGKASALELAKRNGTVYLLCRSKQRGEEAQRELINASKNQQIHLGLVDMASMESIKNFAKEFLDTKPRLRVDCLIHNAGALPRNREENAEGIEMTFATQVLGPHLLTSLLFDRLKESSPSQVIFVSSAGMYTQKLDVKDLQSKRAPFDGTRTYAQMKRAQIILTELWAEKLKPHSVYVNSMHPGWTITPGLTPLFEEKPMYKRFESSFRSVEQGADTIVWLAVKPNLQETGKFFFDREAVATTVRFSGTESSTVDREQLWRTCEELTAKYR